MPRPNRWIRQQVNEALQGFYRNHMVNPTEDEEHMSATDDDWLHVEDSTLDDQINAVDEPEPEDDDDTPAGQFQAGMREEFPRYQMPDDLREWIDANC
jgi:hypothetical protein